MKRYIRSDSNRGLRFAEKNQMRQRTRAVNKSIALDMLEGLSPSKAASLKKALDRNESLTSTYAFPFAALRVYKEGWLLTLEGTRSSFSVWCFDNDGELVEGRKPSESKLNFLYEDNLNFNDIGEDWWYSLIQDKLGH